MDTITICAAFISSILGLAYPVIIQVMARIEEKYYSNSIIKLLFKEKEIRVFQVMLIASISIIIIYLLASFSLLVFPFVVNDIQIVLFSMVFFTIILVIMLIIAFFFLISKILTYSKTEEIIRYVIRRHESARDGEENDLLLNTLKDLLIFSLKRDQREAGRSIAGYFNELFGKYRELDNISVDYPALYYQIIWDMANELVGRKEPQLGYLNYYVLGSVWLLGESGRCTITKNTFKAIWENIVLALSNDRDDLIELYWQNSYQYVSYQLREMPLLQDEKSKQNNSDEIKNRESERERFLEFHNIMGGLLMYMRRYELISRLWSYTTSYPPEYKLLPVNMNQVFSLFFEFIDSYNRNTLHVYNTFPFPNMIGLNAQWEIRSWVCRYAAVLFLRQYTLIPFYSYQDPMKHHDFTEEKRTMRLWIDNLDKFKDYVFAFYNDKDLLKDLKMEYILNAVENGDKSHPEKYFEDVKRELLGKEETLLISKLILPEHRTFLNDQIVRIFKPIMEAVDKANLRSYSITSDYESIYPYLESYKVEKAIFDSDPFDALKDYVSVFGSVIRDNFLSTIYQSFLSHISRKLVIRKESWSDALSKLIEDPSEFVAINLGIASSVIDEIPNMFGDKKLDIIPFDFHWPVQYSSAFLLIIRKENLPFYHFKNDIPKQYEKYGLEVIPMENRLYSSLLDLNEKSDLRDMFKGTEPKVDFRKYALASFLPNVEIRWKLNVKVLGIELYSEYIESSFASKVEDIKSFDDLWG